LLGAVGNQRLRSAMAAKSKSGGVQFSLRWHPILVDRTVGKDGEDRRVYCEVKFGEEFKESPLGAIDRNEAKRDGCAFANWVHWPNTFQAQRLLLLASQQGKARSTVAWLG
jgi:predicted DsbA family dithiol-disulfide isomerase